MALRNYLAKPEVMEALSRRVVEERVRGAPIVSVETHGAIYRPEDGSPQSGQDNKGSVPSDPSTRRGAKIHRVTSELMAQFTHPAGALISSFPLVVFSSALLPASEWWPVPFAEALFSVAFLVLLLAILLAIAMPVPYLSLMATAAICSALLTLFVHVIAYKADTRYATNTRAAAAYGKTVLSHTFSESGICSVKIPDPRLVTAMPLSSCRTENDTLTATMSSSTHSFGFFPGEAHVFRTASVAENASAPRYFVETRFRSVGNSPLTACGLLFQARRVGGRPLLGRDDKIEDRSFFVHLQWKRPAAPWWNMVQIGGYLGGYVTEVLALHLQYPIPSSHPVGITPSILAQNVDALPYFRPIPTVDDWGDDGWIKLSVVVTGDDLEFLVKDRIALSHKYDGLDTVTAVGVAVESGSDHAEGTATCEFDYLRVRELPE